MKKLNQEMLLYIVILIVTIASMLAYNQIVYGDASCLFKKCVVLKEQNEK